ncbi:MAG TPA: DUF881 domain-containing protein [Actinomycetes bacterium]|nr:DUF881 domain-containing protein [Actinomycetes bacterium]
MRPRNSRAQYVVGALLLALGFAMAIQVQSTQESALTSARTTDLVRILDDLGEQRDRLTLEQSRLQATLNELRSGADQAGAARAAARERLRTLGVLAGTVPATGPGITLTISDATGGVSAADLLDAVQELRDAGAEALQIADVRVIGSSSIVDSPNGIMVDGEVVTPPYVIRAIGDSRTLASALTIPGGVIEGVNDAGGRPSVTEQSVVRIDALKPLPKAEYAHPA